MMRTIIALLFFFLGVPSLATYADPAYNLPSENSLDYLLWNSLWLK